MNGFDESSEAARVSPRLAPLHVDSFLQSGLALAAVLAFYTSFDNYLFVLGGPKPKELVLVFSAAAVLAFVVAPQRLRTSLRSPVLLWLLFYFGMTVAWAPFIKGYEDAEQALSDRLRSIATLLAFALVFDDRRARRTAIVAVAACVALASVLNVAELLSLVRFEAGPRRVPGRSSGLHFNANDAALAITLGLAVVIEDVPRSWRVPLALVSIVGVGATFSRGAAVCLALVFLWMARRRVVGSGGLVLGALLGAVLLGSAVTLVESSSLLTDNTAARIRLQGDDSGRIEVALMAWEMFVRSPLVGSGLGATQLWDARVSPHNMYLALAAEHGLLGLLSFPALLVAIFLSNRRAAGFIIVLATAGMFSHGLLEARYVLLLIALTAATPASASAEGVHSLAGHRAAT